MLKAKKPEVIEKRPKLFFFGAAGVGKTRAALQFGRNYHIDCERGADNYADLYAASNSVRLQTTDYDEVIEQLKSLATERHDFQTVTIDPITVLETDLNMRSEDAIAAEFRAKDKSATEAAQLAVGDMRIWRNRDRSLRRLGNLLLALDMNVIVTAREKTKYKEGSFMVAVGETFDGEKSLPYLFDTIVRLWKDPQGRHLGTCLKDRSNKLPKEDFAASYAIFESVFGQQALDRKAKPLTLATEEQKQAIAAAIEQFGMTADQVARRLAAYGADSLDALTKENAELILKKFKEFQAAAAKEPGKT